MNLFGLIGYPLSHSFSAQYFSEKFFKENIHDTRYELYPITEINQIIPLIKKNKELKGLNVTIPYKESIIPYLDFIASDAKEIRAVNTINIIRNDNCILNGFNTDIVGFEESIKPLLQHQHNKALILGTGGAAKAVAYVLRKKGIEYLFVSRTKLELPYFITYFELDKEIISSHLLIVNASPAGMFPNIQEFPDIPYELLTKNHILFDLIYNPTETIFMKKGIAKGARVSNGIKMLYIQAEESWKIWNEL